MSPIVVALAVLVVLACLWGPAFFADPDERQKKKALAEAEARKAKRQRLREELAADLTARGRHLLQRQWKPAIAHITPEKPEAPKAANVTKLRRKS